MSSSWGELQVRLLLSNLFFVFGTNSKVSTWGPWIPVVRSLSKFPTMLSLFFAPGRRPYICDLLHILATEQHLEAAAKMRSRPESTAEMWHNTGCRSTSAFGQITMHAYLAHIYFPYLPEWLPAVYIGNQKMSFNFEFETKALERQSEGGALWSSILDNFIQMGLSLDSPLFQRLCANATDSL